MGRPVSVVYRSFEVPETERILIYISVGLIISGVFIVYSTALLSKCRLSRARKKAVLTRDKYIVPPRCEKKAEEIGLKNVQPWMDYFTRQQPFIPDAE